MDFFRKRFALAFRPSVWYVFRQMNRATIKAVMAHLGRSKSPAKAKAARENGKKGGWPLGKPRGKKKKQKDG